MGAGSGLGAVAFRYLIYFVTWAATGHSQFGQQGHAGSAHLPWLGLGFFVLIPVIGGLLYGPLIYRFAREARGHGVPEVMIAVADNGGRIRPQVSAVKAVASAVCIGVGGSVGREGPIVQIGSALASSLGQWVKMPENRLRILVACGAAGGISATFNAPITGVFFGVEIILREFSVDALFTVMLAAMIADITAIPFLGDKPFLSGFPSGLALHHARNYLLVALLAVVAALMGLAFKAVLYKTEDLCDRVWQGRPEWARPAVGGIALGLLLLAIPQMYGVGYPVMDKATAGQYALWFLILLAFAKIAACSLTIGIGGSGGVFAPSLFIGVTSGMAFGDIVHHIFGAGAGQPALYAVVAMGAVFASAARAPLTSLASVVEMTGDFALTLPVMLAVAIASTISRALSYGTIYTTKLLRRGTDIDRTTPWRALADLKIADAMRPFRRPLPVPPATAASPRRPAPTAATRRRKRPRCLGRSSTRPTRRPCSPPSPSPRRCGSWRSTATTDCPSCPPTAARYPAGSPPPTCCEPSAASSPPSRHRPRRPRSPPTGTTPTRDHSRGTRRPRCPDTGWPRSPSPPARPPPDASSPTSPGRRAAPPSPSCAAISSARRTRSSPWPPATASACSPRRPGLTRTPSRRRTRRPARRPGNQPP